MIFSCHAYLEEDIIDEASVKDLSQREADAPIFSKLHLSYGKAVAFKKEFGMNASKSRPCSPPSAVKPTMANIATFTRVETSIFVKVSSCAIVATFRATL